MDSSRGPLTQIFGRCRFKRLDTVSDIGKGAGVRRLLRWGLRSAACLRFRPSSARRGTLRLGRLSLARGSLTWGGVPGNAVEEPTAITIIEGKVKIDLLRPRRKEARQTQLSVGINRR
jgi:hypothetical protein